MPGKKRSKKSKKKDNSSPSEKASDKSSHDKQSRDTIKSMIIRSIEEHTGQDSPDSESTLLYTVSGNKIQSISTYDPYYPALKKKGKKNYLQMLEESRVTVNKKHGMKTRADAFKQNKRIVLKHEQFKVNELLDESTDDIDLSSVLFEESYDDIARKKDVNTRHKIKKGKTVKNAQRTKSDVAIQKEMASAMKRDTMKKEISSVSVEKNPSKSKSLEQKMSKKVDEVSKVESLRKEASKAESAPEPQVPSSVKPSTDVKQKFNWCEDVKTDEEIKCEEDFKKEEIKKSELALNELKSKEDLQPQKEMEIISVMRITASAKDVKVIQSTTSVRTLTPGEPEGLDSVPRVASKPGILKIESVIPEIPKRKETATVIPVKVKSQKSVRILQDDAKETKMSGKPSKISKGKKEVQKAKSKESQKPDMPIAYDITTPHTTTQIKKSDVSKELNASRKSKMLPSPELLEKPSAPRLVEKPSSPGLVEKPKKPGIVVKPNTPGLVEKPKKPGLVEKPNTPGLVEKPNTPGLVEKPNTPGLVEKPNTPGLVEKPNTPGLVEKPKKPGVVGKPNTPGLIEKPNRPGLVEKSSVSVIAQQPRAPESYEMLKIPGTSAQEIPSASGVYGIAGEPRKLSKQQSSHMFFIPESTVSIIPAEKSGHLRQSTPFSPQYSRKSSITSASFTSDDRTRPHPSGLSFSNFCFFYKHYRQPHEKFTCCETLKSLAELQMRTCLDFCEKDADRCYIPHPNGLTFSEYRVTPL